MSDIILKNTKNTSLTPRVMARLAAIQIYSCCGSNHSELSEALEVFKDFGGCLLPDSLEDEDTDNTFTSSYDFIWIETLVKDALQKQDKILSWIKQHLISGWTMDHMNQGLIGLLIVGGAELIKCDQPCAAVIKSYLMLSDILFSSQKDTAFVNRLLHGLKQEIQEKDK
jgi:transcription termination factor NusB